MLLQKTKAPLLLFTCTFFILAWGCRQGEQRKHENELEKPHSTVLPNYAKGFQIDYFNGYKKVTLHNPWNSSEPYAVYYLYNNNSTTLPTGGTHIKAPISTLSVNTFSYFSFLSLLDEDDVIIGVTDGFRIYNPAILDRLKLGEVTDLGDPFQPNIEKTLALKPDAIISSAYAQRDNYSERLIQAGFPIIYSLEWMENSPLARAEWIKMIATFFDKEELADSLFSSIEHRYLELQERVKNVSTPRTVLSGDNFQGTWYIPGGKSFNATLFHDASLDYRYKNNSESGSIGLDIESVLTQFGKVDYWFGCQADSYAELAEKDAKYLLLHAVKKRQVFNNHNRVTSSGGNDYFESAIANPDLLLSDLVKAAYPELLPHYEFTYIKPLEETAPREKK
jgi:iron complex transport system substrate-binding protein